MASFEGKTAIVTGAGSGIGKAITSELVKRGAKVALAGRREEPLRQLTAELGRAEQLLICPADVTKPAAVELLIETAEAAFGKIDMLFNCAGVFKAAGFASLSTSAIREMMDINYLGTVNCIKAVIPSMQKRQQGQIINISSLGGKYPCPGFTAYSATKYAIAGLSNALRPELRREGIFLTAVYPSFVSSPLLEGHLKTVKESSFYRATGSYTPEQAAKAILKAAARRKREVIVPGYAALTPALYALFPRLFDLIIGKLCGGWPLLDDAD